MRRHIIMVRAREGIEAGVSFTFHWAHVEDGDVGREEAVQFVGQLGAVEGTLDVEVRIHFFGVNAGVGSARA